MRRRRLPLLAAVPLLVLGACGSSSKSASSGTGATSTSTSTTAPAESVSFTKPADGATVARRFDVAMTAVGLKLAPAGTVVPGEGHLHVLVDTPCLPTGQTIPKDATHVHFGKGQTTGQLFLEPGDHALCLQAADGAHSALALTKTIKVKVDGSLPFVTLKVPEGTTTSPLAVTMEAANFKIVPAGAVVTGEGHFHIMVDAPCLTPGTVIPKDETHLHFGNGQTTASLTLTKGDHVLCLQAGDGAHTALPLTHVVSVTIG